MKNKRITRLGLIIFGLALMFFLGAFMARYYNNEIKSISYNDLVKLQKSEDIQLIDVRNIKEYKSGHIKGAINYDFFKSTFISSIDSLDKSKTIVVYCKSGNRSYKSAHILKSLGFTDIYDFNEGINSWNENRNSLVILDSID